MRAHSRRFILRFGAKMYEKKLQTWTRQTGNDTFINVALMYRCGAVGRELAARNINSLSRAHVSIYPFSLCACLINCCLSPAGARGAHIESERRKKRRRDALHAPLRPLTV